MPDLTILKDWSIVAAGLIALITFVFSTIENVRRGRQERVQNFVLMRRRFLEMPQFREILDLLQSCDPGLRDFSIQDKRNFIGFLEEVALLTNSGLIKAEIAHYMFGYYVVLAAKSEDFWHGLDRESTYWAVFREFAQKMAALESRGLPAASTIRF